MEAANQEVVEITSEEFSAWIDNKVTRVVLDEVERYRDYLGKYITSGATLKADKDQSDKSTAEVVGELRGLTQLYLFFSDAKATNKVSDYGH